MGQKGFVHIFVLLILFIGIVVGVYLAQHPQIFKPRASGGLADPIVCKTGVNSFKVVSPCKNNTFADAIVQCHDGQTFNLASNLSITEGVQCKTSQKWSAVAKGVCNNRSSCPLPSSTILKSKFFATDPVAIELVEQNLKRDIRAFTDDPNLTAGHTNSTNIFEYKVISALRMLGMTRPANLSSIYLGEVLLNKFQRLHNLAESPIITSDILRAIDIDLGVREQKDEELARHFPLYNRFTQSPPNQPTKEHIAALYDIAFQALPPNLVHWDATWFENYLKGQYPALVVNPSNGNWEICTGAEFMYGIPDYCSEPNATVVQVFDELNLVGTILHEYAHFLDKNAWPANDIAINTTEFYNISFKDFDPRSYPPVDDLVRYYRRPAPQNRDEFVSVYASSNNFKEDFAESLAMYVMQGRTFRELIKQNMFLSQKYQWLKQNVFQGIEYDTGIYKADTQPSLIGHPADYSFVNPDFYFIYDFPRL